MNIGAVITGPMEDPDWVKKIAIAGLLTFLVCLTIVGIFVALPNLMGWTKLIAEARLRGDKTIPDFSFGNIGEGWRIFLGALLFGVIAMVILIPIGIVFGGLGFVAGKIAAALSVVVSLVMMLVMLAVYVLLGLASPIVTTRIMLDGNTMAATGIVDIMKTARANLGICLMFLVTIIVVSLVTSVMGIVPILGAIFGIGYSAVAQGIALAQFRQTGVQ